MKVRISFTAEVDAKDWAKTAGTFLAPDEARDDLRRYLANALADSNWQSLWPLLDEADGTLEVK